MSSTPKRAALYCRISENEEGVDKTANQESALRKLAASSGYDIQGVYTDDGISAYRGKLERPEWTRMLRTLQEGVIDVVMAVAPDRFTRGSAAELEALNVLCVEAGAVIHTKSAGVQDPATPMTRAMLAIQDIFGGLEVDVKRQKQLDRIEADLAKGLPLWGARPFGFDISRQKVEPVEAQAIRDAYRAILEEGSTFYSIAGAWNKAGPKTTYAGKERTRQDGTKYTPDGTWTTSTVRQVLARPRNCGILEHKGELLGESLPAIVTRAQWEERAPTWAPSREDLHRSCGVPQR